MSSSRTPLERDLSGFHETPSRAYSPPDIAVVNEPSFNPFDALGLNPTIDLAPADLQEAFRCSARQRSEGRRLSTPATRDCFPSLRQVIHSREYLRVASRNGRAFNHWSRVHVRTFWPEFPPGDPRVFDASTHPATLPPYPTRRAPLMSSPPHPPSSQYTATSGPGFQPFSAGSRPPASGTAANPFVFSDSSSDGDEDVPPSPGPLPSRGHRGGRRGRGMFSGHGMFSAPLGRGGGGAPSSGSRTSRGEGGVNRDASVRSGTGRPGRVQRRERLVAVTEVPVLVGEWRSFSGFGRANAVAGIFGHNGLLRYELQRHDGNGNPMPLPNNQVIAVTLTDIVLDLPFRGLTATPLRQLIARRSIEDLADRSARDARGDLS